MEKNPGPVPGFFLPGFDNLPGWVKFLVQAILLLCSFSGHGTLILHIAIHLPKLILCRGRACHYPEYLSKGPLLIIRPTSPPHIINKKLSAPPGHLPFYSLRLGIKLWLTDGRHLTFHSIYKILWIINNYPPVKIGIAMCGIKSYLEI